MRTICTILFLILGQMQLFCQNNELTVITNNRKDYKFSLYTTYLTFSNFGKTETNTQHYELQLAYQLSQKDRIGIKLATWKLFAPMGIPIWHNQFLEKESFYSGRLRETGIGGTYQRKLWKGLFVTLEVLPLFTSYLDDTGHKMAKGFKLYNSYHLGYQIPLFKKGRFFIEPQFHINHWLINTNVPEEFKNEEDKWNNFFLIEPNLYIGIKF